MFIRPASKKVAKELETLIDGCSAPVITCHVKPDGDAVGSSLALWHLLRLIGKEPFVVMPDAPPSYLRFLPGCKEVVSFSGSTDFASRLIEEADVIFCLDFNDTKRVDRMEEELTKAGGTKVLIDHHLDPRPFAHITVSEPATSSTCFLLYKLVCQLGWHQLIDKAAATCIAAGMMTDTGNFSYNANDPEAYMAMANLLRCGVDKVAVWNQLNVKTESQLRLNGYALSEKMRLLAGNQVALMQLTTAELERFHYQKGDLEGVVNMPLEVPGVKVSVLMHAEPDFIKVSCRSRGIFPVNRLCEQCFGGGGHLNAAGGEFRGDMTAAFDALEHGIEELKSFLDNQNY